MLILIGIVPVTFAVDLSTSQASIAELTATTQTISFQMDRHAPGVAMAGSQVAADELSSYLKTSGKAHRPHLRRHRNQVPRNLANSSTGHKPYATLTRASALHLRSDLYLSPNRWAN